MSPLPIHNFGSTIDGPLDLIYNVGSIIDSFPPIYNFISIIDVPSSIYNFCSIIDGPWPPIHPPSMILDQL